MVIKNVSKLTATLILLLPVLTLLGTISFDQMKLFMLIGTIVWFVLAPFWIKKD